MHSAIHCVTQNSMSCTLPKPSKPSQCSECTSIPLLSATPSISSSSTVSTPSFLPPSLNHLVILDWDDTMMPTTFLMTHYDLDIDRKTRKVRAIRLKPNSKLTEKEICRQLTESGFAALRMLKALYLHFVDGVHGRNLLIVTNGKTEWLHNSLSIAGTLCPIYRQIDELLYRQNTEILYARNHRLNPNHWKMACFDRILWRYLERKRCHRLNVITIGDQWTDHCSIESTTTFRRHFGAISHHQIKLFPAADARYLGVELNYIAEVLSSADQCALCQFAEYQNDGIIIEFDGYQSEKNEGGDGVSVLSDSECPDTPPVH